MCRPSLAGGQAPHLPPHVLHRTPVEVNTLHGMKGWRALSARDAFQMPKRPLSATWWQSGVLGFASPTPTGRLCKRKKNQRVKIPESGTFMAFFICFRHVWDSIGCRVLSGLVRNTQPSSRSNIQSSAHCSTAWARTPCSVLQAAVVGRLHGAQGTGCRLDALRLLCAARCRPLLPVEL